MHPLSRAVPAALGFCASVACIDPTQAAKVDDIPNPVPALEMEAAQASYWAASDGSDFDAAALDVALSGKAPSDRTTTLPIRVSQRARCAAVARKNGEGAKPDQPVIPLEAGVTSSAFVLQYGDNDISCQIGQRTENGSRTVRTIDGTGGGNVRTLEVTAQAGGYSLAEPVQVVTISGADADQPAYTLGVQTQLAAGDRSLRLAFDLARKRAGTAPEESLTMRIRAQDSNSLLVNQNLATVDDSVLRVDYGNGTAATARTIVSGQVEVDLDQPEIQASHGFENLAFDYSQPCSCPTGGILRQTLRYASGRVARNVFTFTACGRADVTSTVGELGGDGISASSESGVALWNNCH